MFGGLRVGPELGRCGRRNDMERPVSMAGLVMNSGYEWDISYYPMKHAMTMDMVIDMVIHYPN